MITISWTNKATSDLVRLYEFVAPANKKVAAKIVQSLSKAPDTLTTHPKLGEKVDGFDPREVRRIIVGDYEMRYEIKDNIIYILRIWHTKEYR
jgi:plasmid stabilization system protein ParE